MSLLWVYEFNINAGGKRRNYHPVVLLVARIHTADSKEEKEWDNEYRTLCINFILQVLLDIPSNVVGFLLAPRVSNHDGHP